MKYVYHYCASFQPRPNQITFIDGIYTRDTPLNGDIDEYLDMKAKISDQPGLTIRSLSLISSPEA